MPTIAQLHEDLHLNRNVHAHSEACTAEDDDHEICNARVGEDSLRGAEAALVGIVSLLRQNLEVMPELFRLAQNVLCREHRPQAWIVMHQFRANLSQRTCGRCLRSLRVGKGIPGLEYLASRNFPCIKKEDPVTVKTATPPSNDPPVHPYTRPSCPSRTSAEENKEDLSRGSTPVTSRPPAPHPSYQTFKQQAPLTAELRSLIRTSSESSSPQHSYHVLERRPSPTAELRHLIPKSSESSRDAVMMLKQNSICRCEVM